MDVERAKVILRDDPPPKKKEDLYPLKFHYLFHGLGGAPVLPFMSVIIKQLGIPSQGIGLIFTLKQFILIIMRPMVGGLMDSYPHRKMHILRTLVLLELIGYYMVRFAPPWETGEPLMAPGCSESLNYLTLTTNSHVSDPCLVSKIKDNYAGSHMCEFSCHQSSSSSAEPQSFTASFLGQDVVTNERKQLTLSLADMKCSDLLQKSDDNNWEESGVKCFANCSDQSLRHILNKPEDESFQARGFPKIFWLLLFFFVIGKVCGGGVMTFQEAICNQMVAGHKDQHYGTQRMYASFGWGVSAMIVGHLMDRASSESLLSDYTLGFEVMLVAWIADVVAISFMKVPYNSLSKISRSNPFCETLNLLRRKEVMVYILYCICAGVCYGIVPFHFLLLEELSDNSGDCATAKNLKLIQGLVLTVTTLGEIPVFFYSNRLLTKFGPTAVMNTTLLMVVVRFFYYSQISLPWHSIPMELINGACFGLLYPAMTTFAYKIAPKGAETTVTAMAFVAHEGIPGIGIAIGGYIGGGMFQTIGGSLTYYYFGLFAILSLVIHVTLQRLIRNKRNIS